MATKPYLSCESVALVSGAKPFSLVVTPGARIAVVGRADSGVAEFVSLAAKKASAAEGKAVHHGKATLCSAVPTGSRTTPASLVKPDGTTRGAGALGLLGLWEDRHTACHKLGWRKLAACRLVAPLVSRDGLWVVDGELDAVDLRVAVDFCDEMAETAERKKALVVATSSPTVVQRLGEVVVMRNHGVAFVGGVEELVRTARPAEVVVQSPDPGAVAAMCEPLALRVVTSGDTVEVSTLDGQALAARLLTEGYGSVRAVVVRQPDVLQSLLELM